MYAPHTYTPSNLWKKNFDFDFHSKFQIFCIGTILFYHFDAYMINIFNCTHSIFHEFLSHDLISIIIGFICRFFCNFYHLFIYWQNAVPFSSLIEIKGVHKHSSHNNWLHFVNSFFSIPCGNVPNFST